MLSKRDVITLYNDGLSIKWRRKNHPQQLKGDYDPVNFEINLYRAHLASEYEQDLTLLHECIHARDDRKGALSTRPCCDRVEKEAEATYRLRPAVLALIKELYTIRSDISSHAE